MENMTEEHARRLARDEQLNDIVWFQRPVNRADSVAIYGDAGGWKVSTTDERAVESAIEVFDSQADALAECLERSRAGKAANR